MLEMLEYLETWGAVITYDILTLDLWFFCVAGPAVIFAGISKGGFGSGAAFAAASVLALVIEPGLALGVMLPLLMLIDAFSLRPYWSKWSGIDVKLLVIWQLTDTTTESSNMLYSKSPGTL